MLKRMLFRYQGHVSAALVLGGVDNTGAHLYQIYPHGSTDKNPYVTMGSGSLAAMSVFETGFKEDMSEVIMHFVYLLVCFLIYSFIYSLMIYSPIPSQAEAIELVKEAILAGIFNDLGSGSNVDLTIIRKTGEVSVLRGYVTPNDLEPLRTSYPRPSALTVPAGATAVMTTHFEPARKALEGLVIEDATAMTF